MNKYLLIHTDGYSINHKEFTSFEAAAAEMESQYKAYMPDFLEEQYQNLTYIGENSAALYNNGEDVYLWEIIEVKLDLSEDDKDNIYREKWVQSVIDDVRAYAESEDIELTDKQVTEVANLYVNGKYDCNVDYWTNIQSLVDKVTG